MAEENPLISLLGQCVVRIDRGEEFSGNGFFVAPGEILTCAHVVEGETLTVSRDDWVSPVEVVASAPPLVAGSLPAGFPFPDIALLRVPDAPDGHPCVLLSAAMPATGADADVFMLSGFSLLATHQRGVEQTATRVVFEGTVGEAAVIKLREGQIPSGFSGCPALNTRTGSVCGVVDSTRDKKSDLGGFAIPISVVAGEFEGLLERNRDAHEAGAWKRTAEEERTAAARRRGEAEKLPILSPPYELDPEAEYAPSELLKPRYGVVETIEREGMREQLTSWRESNEPLDLLLVSGGAGTGKTRLALDECTRAGQAGWMAGLLTLDAVGNHRPELERLLAWPGQLFLAIDYAETRPDVVRALVGGLARRPAGPRVRLMLLGRQLGAQGEIGEMFASGDDRELIAPLLKNARRVALDEPEHAIDGRRLFEAGVVAFAARLGQDGSAVAVVEPPQRGHFDRPLFVLAAALLRAEDPSIDIDALAQDGLMLELIDRHENQYWQRWDIRLGTELDRTLQAPAVALATLLGAETEAEALSMVKAVPNLEQVGGERALAIARWLSHLYASGELDRPPAISPVEPDMLGETLVARECLKRPELIGRALDIASDVQLARMLTVLARACAGDERLAGAVGSSLGARLTDLVDRVVDLNSSELAVALELAVLTSRPVPAAAAARRAGGAGPTWGGLAAALYRVAVDTMRDSVGEEVAARNEFAELLTGFANALGADGGGEGLVAVEEAVRIRADLVEAGFEEYEAALKDSQNSLDGLLATADEPRERALEPIELTVGTSKELAERDRRYLPPLSRSLVAFSGALNKLGRTDEAVLAAEEAVQGYRKLVKDDPEGCLPGLVTALGELIVTLPRDRWEREAAALTKEMVERGQELFVRDRKRYEAEVRMTVSSFSQVFGGGSNLQPTLGTVERMVEMLRVLVDGGVESYRAELAESLNQLAVALDISGLQKRAVTSASDALACYRKLVEGDPTDYMPLLAISLDNLATIMRNQGREKAALRKIERELERNRQQQRSGFVLLIRARWHAEAGDAVSAIGDAACALDDGEAAEDSELCSEARTVLGQLRGANGEAFDRAWEKARGGKRPDWLVDWSMEKEGWEKIYERPEEPEQSRGPLWRWIFELGGEESFEYLEDHAAELLTPRVKGALRKAALLAPEHPGLFSRLAVLDLASRIGPAAVPKVLEQGRALTDDECLGAADDPEILLRARLYEDGAKEHPELSFWHALAAAVAGEEEEADQALARCRRLLWAGEEGDYLDRIDALLELPGNHSAALERLRGALLAADQAA
jgi:hypothetical protein